MSFLKVPNNSLALLIIRNFSCALEHLLFDAISETFFLVLFKFMSRNDKLHRQQSGCVEAFNEAFELNSANSWHWKLISLIRRVVSSTILRRRRFFFTCIFVLQNYACQCQVQFSLSFVRVSLCSCVDFFSCLYQCSLYDRKINVFLISSHKTWIQHNA